MFFILVVVLAACFFSMWYVGHRELLEELANTPRRQLDLKIKQLCKRSLVAYPDYLHEEEDQDDELDFMPEPEPAADNDFAFWEWNFSECWAGWGERTALRNRKSVAEGSQNRE